MRNQLQKFAEDFSNQLEMITHEDSEQRSVNHPVVFLFLGDLVAKALKSIITINKKSGTIAPASFIFMPIKMKPSPAPTRMSCP